MLVKCKAFNISVLLVYHPQVCCAAMADTDEAHTLGVLPKDSSGQDYDYYTRNCPLC